MSKNLSNFSEEVCKKLLIDIIKLNLILKD